MLLLIVILQNEANFQSDFNSEMGVSSSRVTSARADDAATGWLRTARSHPHKAARDCVRRLDPGRGDQNQFAGLDAGL
jgi:hypothetical protein